MNRRGFLTGILALGAAPAIVRAESLMKGRGIIVPQAWAFNSRELAFDPADFSSHYLQPAIIQIADEIDSALICRGNRLLTAEEVTREGLRILNGKMGFINNQMDSFC